MRVSVLASLLAGAVSASACEQYDPKLIEEQNGNSPTPANDKDGGARDGGPRSPSDGAAVQAGNGGSSAAGGGTAGSDLGALDGGLAGAGIDCVVNTGASGVFCPYVCREVCNEQDDDCDGLIDEGSSDELCPAANALAACIAGECVIAECTEAYRDCDGDPLTGCEVAPEDPNNCGSCGRKCELLHAVATCVEGVCARAACEPLYDDCDENPDDCETAVTTLDNCAMCSTSCSDVPNATASCGLGFCGVGQCAIGFGDCNVTPGDGCEQTLDTLEHCGGCAETCDMVGSSDDCLAGVCLANSCDTGFEQCDGDRGNGCERLDSTQNCSACGRRCDDTLDNVAQASCSGGECQPSCDPGYGNCDGDAFTGCETALDSEQHCLGCDTVCQAPNAVMACGDSGCELVQCRPGWGDCNDDVALDGCETSLNQDAHCGSCTRACAAPDPVCSGGTCSDVTCAAGLADCNQDGFPCEVDLRTDANNCAACGAKCEYSTPTPHASAPTCVASSCRANCENLRADCNTDYRDGCERALTTLTSCGGCGVGCSIANATATCATGSCRVQTCSPDFADCNTDGTSCETRLDTTQNCGACGAVCNLPGAVPSCAGTAGSHSCAITACNSAFLADCDGVAATGCEVDRRSAVAHCGACNNDCRTQPNVASATCSNSSCRPTCTAGFGDCDPGRAGCETSLRTLSDCGACGVSCSRPGGGETCETGSCQLTGCDPDFDDCDGNPNNGCEPLSTVANCGACDSPCTIVNGDGDCGTGSCEVASCDSGWADCNDDPSDGCERNTNSPAMGGQGPCLPDPSCTRFAFGGRDAYFCTADRTWSQARALCQSQLLGDLVHVDDAAENTFVQSHLNNIDAWLGGSDTGVEGTWRWANDTGRFWMGVAGGSGTGFTFWQSGEPNNNANDEDCLMMYATSARWNDAGCNTVRDFVCEVQPDLCPDDPQKANPLQCGCGNPETDSDSDGTANCNDQCPNDPLKTLPGACNCGVADTNSDGDAQPDCLDECDSDPAKTAAGACGCGTPDTNSDGDAQPDCNDQCPLDAARVTLPCSFDYAPSNFDPATLDFDGAPTTTLDCQATTTINTSANTDAVKENQVTFTNWCGTAPRPLVRAQANGPEVVIIPLQGLTLAATRNLRLIGSRPVIFAVRGDVNIAGTLNARGLASETGAGGNTSCSSAGRGGDGANTGSNDGDSGGGGGGGGAFAGGGANGGTGNVAFGSNDRGGAGTAAAAAAGSLAPLRGGCSGGKGGNGNGTGPSGGGGGGAVQIAASGSLILAGSAVISASGGGGPAATHQEDGGAGGGSGGGVLLEAGVINIADNAWITANGGGGSSGSATNSVNSARGQDGAANNSGRAPRGAGNDGGGGGGEGSVITSNGPGGGGNGQGTGLFGLVTGGGGGGGGGAVGFIRVRGTRSCTADTEGNFSPPAARACP